MLEYPEGVASVTEAERMIDIEVLAGATEGAAETPPVFAKATGISGPKTSKRSPAISEARSLRDRSRLMTDVLRPRDVIKRCEVQVQSRGFEIHKSGLCAQQLSGSTRQERRQRWFPQGFMIELNGVTPGSSG